ncbi:Uncharacterised protein [uncultured archaeon]|nr:Uncharacterised protein [uncultured archaeon]
MPHKRRISKSHMLPGGTLPPEKNGGRGLMRVGLATFENDPHGGQRLEVWHHMVIKRGFKRKTEAKQKSHLIDSDKAWAKLKKAGLPVPQVSIVDLRKSIRTRFGNKVSKTPNRLYLQRLVEDMAKEHGHLYPVQRPHSVLKLSSLDPRQNPSHEILIREMAHDLTTMYSSGVMSRTGTIWHFYRKRTGELDRVIVNLDSLSLIKNPQQAVKYFTENIGVLSKQFDHDARDLFMEEVKKSHFWKSISKTH